MPCQAARGLLLSHRPPRWILLHEGIPQPASMVLPSLDDNILPREAAAGSFFDVCSVALQTSSWLCCKSTMPVEVAPGRCSVIPSPHLHTLQPQPCRLLPWLYVTCDGKAVRQSLWRWRSPGCCVQLCQGCLEHLKCRPGKSGVALGTEEVTGPFPSSPRGIKA